MATPFIPPEILAHIYGFACTDDGRTYQALSLVSHTSRAIAAPYRLQSLVLSSPDKIRQVANELKAQPGLRCQMGAIRYLFVSDSQLEDPLSVEHPQVGGVDKDSASRRNTPQSFDLGKTDLALILSLAAPTLSSLVIDASHSVFSSTSLIAHLFSLSLPELVDLEIIGFYPYPHARTPRAAESTSTVPPMPKLTRLSLTGNRNPVGLLQRGNLNSACPSLQTLHLRGLAQAVPFALELQQAVDCCIRYRNWSSSKGEKRAPFGAGRVVLGDISNAPEADGGNAEAPVCPWPARLPESLEHITLEVADVLKRSPSSTAAQKQAEMQRVFKTVREKCQAESGADGSSRLTVEVADPKAAGVEEKMRCNFGRMRVQWSERLQAL